MNTAMKLVVAIFLFIVGTVVQATLFTIDEVLGGSSGFSSSLFHDASGSNPMSGSILASIPSVAVLSGSYNDITGNFSATMSVSTGGTFTLSGTGLLFDVSDTLAANSQLSISFTNPTGALQNDELGFLPGYVCCGSTDLDPNSFISTGSGMIMTLWGANFGGGIFDGNYYTHDLGIDLRLSLSEVPVPSAVWLFGSGLLGIVGVARRKKA